MVLQVHGNLGSACTASSQVGGRAFRVVFLPLLLHVIMLLLLCANEVSGKTVMVGGFSGWTNYDPKLDATPNYQEWAASLTIEINDTLGKQLHDIHSFSSIFFPRMSIGALQGVYCTDEGRSMKICHDPNLQLAADPELLHL
jgi:hypothetical protein